MIFKAGIRFPFDEMVPAYDLEFHPSVMCFVAPGVPRCRTATGTTMFIVHDTYEVRCFDSADTEVEFRFRCLPSEYSRLKNIYKGGQNK